MKYNYEQELKINTSIGRVHLYGHLSRFFLTKGLPNPMIRRYLSGKEEDKKDLIHEMTEYIASHLKPELAFSQSMPVLDAIEALIAGNEDENLTVTKDY